MRLSLITLGDPDRLTGGYLYHRRIADLASSYGVDMRFTAVPDGPLGIVRARSTVAAAATDTEVVAVDSIVAAQVSPWVATVKQPVVAVAHQPPGGIDHGRPATAVLRRLDLRSYRRVTTVIAASQSIAQSLVTAGLDARRVTVVPPGRDGPPARTGAGYERVELRQGRRAAVLCVANWQQRKGIVELLDALRGLPLELVTLHLVGATDVEPRYGRRVWSALASDELAGRVTVHGRVDRAEVDRLYRSADFFVLASYREPYGTVYGEAMAHGLPVIGWAAGNLPNLITDGREGLAVSPGNVHALSVAIAAIADDPGRRSEMSDAARRRADDLPTWAESAERFFAVIRETASRAGHADR